MNIHTFGVFDDYAAYLTESSYTLILCYARWAEA
jgi:hypothetical protein